MNLLTKFKCPDCGERKLEEIVVAVTVANELLYLDSEYTEEVEIGPLNVSDGVTDRFQCYNCGYVLVNEDDDNICSPEELAEWLITHERKK